MIVVNAATRDPYVVSLLHFNGADASTTFTDEITGKVWTANGNAQIDTAQSKFGGASGLFDGTGDYISCPDHADWRLDGGTGADFSVDFWVRFNGDPGAAIVGFVQQYVDDSNFWTVRLNNNQAEFVVREAAVQIILVQYAWNPATATWYHFAVERVTNDHFIYVDGVSLGVKVTDTSTFPDFAGALQVGRQQSSGATNYHTGWIEELRIRKGAYAFNGPFTPPTTEYT